MAEVISDLEKLFQTQKKRFYIKIDKLKKEKLKKYKQINLELNKLKKHEQDISEKERNVSSQLNRLKHSIKNSIEKADMDKGRIRHDIEEIKKLRKEIPQLKALAKVSKQQKEKLFGKEKLLSNELNRLHQELLKKGYQKEKLEQLLKDFTNKEKMLSSGRIYWHAVEKKGKPVQKHIRKIARKAVARRKSLLSQLFSK